MLGLYDILGAGYSVDRAIAWSLGRQVDGLPRLSAADARILVDSWEWNARPGQRWAPGPEFITDNQCGRGAGKNHAASETMCDASCDPERWGGEGLIVGVNPSQVKRDCLV